MNTSSTTSTPGLGQTRGVSRSSAPVGDDVVFELVDPTYLTAREGPRSSKSCVFVAKILLFGYGTVETDPMIPTVEPLSSSPSGRRKYDTSSNDAEDLEDDDFDNEDDEYQYNQGTARGRRSGVDDEDEDEENHMEGANTNNRNTRRITAAGAAFMYGSGSQQGQNKIKRSVGDVLESYYVLFNMTHRKMTIALGLLMALGGVNDVVIRGFKSVPPDLFWMIIIRMIIVVCLLILTTLHYALSVRPHRPMVTDGVGFYKLGDVRTSDFAAAKRGELLGFLILILGPGTLISSYAVEYQCSPDAPPLFREGNCHNWISAWVVLAVMASLYITRPRAKFQLVTMAFAPVPVLAFRWARPFDSELHAGIKAFVYYAVIFLFQAVALVDEWSNRCRFETAAQLRKSARRQKQHQMALTESLRKLVPSIDKLTKRQVVIDSRQYVLLSLFRIDDFNHWTTTQMPMSVMSVMEKLFSWFDNVGENMGIDKLTSAGDSYLASTNLRARLWEHAGNHKPGRQRSRRGPVGPAMIDSVDSKTLLDFALIQHLQLKQARSKGGNILSAFRGRIAIHCGPAVGVVLGTQSLSYDVFGDALTTLTEVLPLAPIDGTVITGSAQAFLGGGAEAAASWLPSVKHLTRRGSRGSLNRSGGRRGSTGGFSSTDDGDLDLSGEDSGAGGLDQLPSPKLKPKKLATTRKGTNFHFDDLPADSKQFDDARIAQLGLKQLRTVPPKPRKPEVTLTVLDDPASNPRNAVASNGGSGGGGAEGVDDDEEDAHENQLRYDYLEERVRIREEKRIENAAHLRKWKRERRQERMRRRKSEARRDAHPMGRRASGYQISIRPGQSPADGTPLSTGSPGITASPREQNPPMPPLTLSDPLLLTKDNKTQTTGDHTSAASGDPSNTAGLGTSSEFDGFDSDGSLASKHPGGDDDEEELDDEQKKANRITSGMVSHTIRWTEADFWRHGEGDRRPHRNTPSPQPSGPDAAPFMRMNNTSRRQDFNSSSAANKNAASSGLGSGGGSQRRSCCEKIWISPSYKNPEVEAAYGRFCLKRNGHAGLIGQLLMIGLALTELVVISAEGSSTLASHLFLASALVVLFGRMAFRLIAELKGWTSNHTFYHFRQSEEAGKKAEANNGSECVRKYLDHDGLFSVLGYFLVVVAGFSAVHPSLLTGNSLFFIIACSAAVREEIARYPTLVVYSCIFVCVIGIGIPCLAYFYPPKILDMVQLLVVVFGYALIAIVADQQRRTHFECVMLAQVLQDRAQFAVEAHHVLLEMLIPPPLIPAIKAKAGLDFATTSSTPEGNNDGGGGGGVNPGVQIVQWLGDVCVATIKLAPLRGELSGGGLGVGSPHSRRGSSTLPTPIQSTNSSFAPTFLPTPSSLNDSAANRNASFTFGGNASGSWTHSSLGTPGTGAGGGGYAGSGATNHTIYGGSAYIKKLEAAIEALERAIAVRGDGLLYKVSTLGDVVTVAGPIIDKKVLPDKTSNQLRAGGSYASSNAPNVGKNALLNLDAGEDKVLDAAVAMSEMIRMLMVSFGKGMTAAVTCDSAFAGVMGSTRPRLDLLGNATRSTRAIVEAAPSGYVGFLSGIVRLLEAGHKCPPRYHGDIELGPTEPWALRGHGLSRIRRVQLPVTHIVASPREVKLVAGGGTFSAFGGGGTPRGGDAVPPPTSPPEASPIAAPPGGKNANVSMAPLGLKLGTPDATTTTTISTTDEVRSPTEIAATPRSNNGAGSGAPSVSFSPENSSDAIPAPVMMSTSSASSSANASASSNKPSNANTPSSKKKAKKIVVRTEDRDFE